MRSQCCAWKTTIVDALLANEGAGEFGIEQSPILETEWLIALDEAFKRILKY